jgi:hypothetical protein
MVPPLNSDSPYTQYSKLNTLTSDLCTGRRPICTFAPLKSMPSTLASISTLLDSAGIKHRQKDDFIRTGFSTDLYEDDDGDFGVNIILRLEENGELLRIQAPMAYRLPKEASPETQLALLRTINQLHWESKILQVEMDSEDGEIRLSIDFPIEDGQLTETQLARMVRLIPSLIDQGHLAMRDALEKAIPLPSEAEISRRFDAFVRSRG